MLIDKIEGRTAVIGVIGLGYVGLPLAVEKAKAGFPVIGFDIQEKRVAMVNEGHNYIGDVVDEDLERLAKSKKLRATADFDLLRECDVMAICVPTPLDVFKQPDLSYVIRSAKEISKRLRRDTLVVLESTSYPGTTEDVIKPILEETGMVCGQDFYLAFSPERVDPGNLRFKTKNTPKIVGGYGAMSTKIAKSMYEKVLDAAVFTVSSPKEAEMAKVLENTFRNVNIALINEMTILAQKMGIDIWEVIEAAATKPFGFMPFYPGPGIGGHCIPIDPFYLTYIARKHDSHTRLIEAASEINDEMPQYILRRLMMLLNESKKCLNGAKIILLGIAYKGDIDDTRESPALKVLELLYQAKADVTIVDPYVEAFKWEGIVKRTEPLLRNRVREADAVLITTAHKKGVDYRMVCEEASLVFDTKNILKTFDVDRSRVFVL